MLSADNKKVQYPEDSVVPGFEIMLEESRGTRYIKFRFATREDAEKFLVYQGSKIKTKFPEEGNDSNILAFDKENILAVSKFLLLKSTDCILPVKEFLTLRNYLLNNPNFLTEEEKKTLDANVERHLIQLKEKNKKLEALSINLARALSSHTDSIAVSPEIDEIKQDKLEKNDKDDEEEENTPITYEGSIEEDEQEEYKTVHYEIDENIDFTDSIFPEQLILIEEQLQAANEHNKALLDKIQSHYKQIEQYINDRSRLTNTICAFFKLMMKFIEKKETQMPENVRVQVESGLVDVPTSGSFLASNKLDKCTTVRELEENISNLIKCSNENTTEGKITNLLKWVARNCKTAYNYTLSKIEPAAQAIIRTAVSTPSSVFNAGRSLFSQRSSKHSSAAEEESKQQSQRNGPQGEV